MFFHLVARMDARGHSPWGSALQAKWLQNATLFTIAGCSVCCDISIPFRPVPALSRAPGAPGPELPVRFPAGLSFWLGQLAHPFRREL